MTTIFLFSVLLFGKRFQDAHLVALSACSLLLHISGGLLAAEDGTRPLESCIFQVLSVEVLTKQIFDGVYSATGVAYSKGHFNFILAEFVSICRITR